MKSFQFGEFSDIELKKLQVQRDLLTNLVIYLVIIERLIE